jgi:hypothetical protein
MSKPNQAIKLLNAAAATGAGSVVAEVNGDHLGFYFIITGTATGKIETSPDGTTWVDTSLTSKSASGYFALEEAHRYVRANVTAFTDGTVTMWLAQPR